eukprot:3567630-Prymnesium_polylepis.2
MEHTYRDRRCCARSAMCAGPERGGRDAATPATATTLHSPVCVSTRHTATGIASGTADTTAGNGPGN